MAEIDFEASPLAPRRTEEEQARDRDLGFGSVVSRDSRQRLLNPDGSFNVVRSGLGLLETLAPYQQMLGVSWTGFFGIVLAIYLIINIAFALMYLALGPNALVGTRPEMFGGAFSQAFFFSIQTFATIGYGQIGPNGFLANTLVTFEALVGLMSQALATGLLFARFSRPTASILFSRRAIIAPYSGGQSLQFRIANRRKNEIIQLETRSRSSRWRGRSSIPSIRTVRCRERRRTTSCGPKPKYWCSCQESMKPLLKRFWRDRRTGRRKSSGTSGSVRSSCRSTENRCRWISAGCTILSPRKFGHLVI
jgi:Ion channel